MHGVGAPVGAYERGTVLAGDDGEESDRGHHVEACPDGWRPAERGVARLGGTCHRRRRVGGGWSPRAVRSSGLWGQTRLGGSQVPDGQPTGAAMGHRDAVVAWSGVDRTGVEPLFARTH